MRWYCRLGLHNWGQWYFVHTEDVESRWEGTKYKIDTYAIHIRHCKDCRLRGYKRVKI
jgi:hypothetical protein